MADRDIRLKISATADGEDQLRALALEIDKLAKEGGEAAPALGQMADKLRELSNQQSLIDKFGELKRVTAEQSKAWEEATRKTAEAARALREKQNALTSATESEREAKAALDAAKKATEEAGLSTRKAAAELKPLREAYRDAAKESRAAAAAVTQTGKEFNAARKAAAGSKAELEKQNVALHETRKAAQASGVSIAELAKSQIQTKAATAALAAEVERLKQSAQTVGKALQEGGNGAGKMGKDIDGAAKATGGLKAALAPLAGIISAAFVVDQVARTNAELENIDRTFRVLTGSAAGAKREMDYVRAVADRLGINALDAARAFSQLSASTKGTGVEGAKTKAVFEAVALSMSVAGKSSNDTEGALQALSQMASKGVVQLEELRGQLGERLPGALNAVASGFDITTDQLVALIESGRVTADELFPALTKGLNDLYGAQMQSAAQTQTLTQEWAHFKNSVTDAYKAIGDSGGVALMKWTLEALGATATVTSNAIVTLGKTIGTFAAAVANGDLTIRGFSATANAAFAQIEAEAREKLVQAAMHNDLLAASLDAAGQKALEAARAQAAGAQAAAAGGQAAQAAAVGQAANAQAITAAGSAAAAAAGSQGINAQATTAAGAAAEQAAGMWTKLNVAYATIEKAVAASIKLAEESVAARKAEGESAIALAEAFGSEVQQLSAANDAAATNAAALADLAERKKELYAVAAANLAALQEEVAAHGRATAAQQKVIDELTRTVAVRKEDAAQAVAQAAASKIAAAAAQVESQSYYNNAGRLVELKAAYQQTAAAVESLRAAKAAGVDVTNQLAGAEISAGQAAALYRDALRDQVAIMEASNTVRRAEVDLSTAGLRLAVEKQRTTYEVARAIGDEYGATVALNDIKKLEIKLAELTAQAKKAEADAALALVNAKRAELEASGPLTEEKEKELEALQLAAKAKEVEAQIAGETAKRMRELSESTGAFGQASSDAAGSAYQIAGGIGAIGAEAEESAKKLADLRDGINTVDEMVAAREKGKRQIDAGSTDGTTELYRAGASVEEAMAAKKYFSEAFQRESFRASQGRTGTITRFDKIADEAARVALNLARAEQAGAQIDMGDPISEQIKRDQAMQRGAGAGLGTTANPSNSAMATTHRVTINIGGREREVNMASSGDSEALVSMLRSLETAASKAY